MAIHTRLLSLEALPKNVAGDEAGMATVGTGLLVMAWTIAGILILIATAGAVVGTGVHVPTILAEFVLLTTFVCAHIALLVGEALCLAAPAESGAKGLIIGALSCQVTSILLNVVTQTIGITSTGMALAIGLVALAANIGYFVLFFLFLKKIATYARLHDHASRVTILLFGIPTCLAVVIGSSLILPALRGGGALVGLMALFLMGGVGIAMLVFFVMYLFLLFRLGSDLRRM